MDFYASELSLQIIPRSEVKCPSDCQLFYTQLPWPPKCRRPLRWLERLELSRITITPELYSFDDAAARSARHAARFVAVSFRARRTVSTVHLICLGANTGRGGDYDNGALGHIKGQHDTRSTQRSQKTSDGGAEIQHFREASAGSALESATNSPNCEVTLNIPLTSNKNIV